MARPSAKDKFLTYALTPASWIYGAVTWMRNMLFDKGVLRQEEFDIPVVCVGNLTVGGTGKTPHVEFLLNNIASGLDVAVLSRGYGRQTRGFVLANSHSTPQLIGDEPMQIYQKFGSRVKVAVCESRSEGIRQLMRLFPDLQLILLDDAFQHRYVKPSVAILLMDYSRPVYDDKLLPLGTLRESVTGMNRADYIFVTKCPADLSQIDKRLIANELSVMPYQKLFFSRFEYGGLTPVFRDDAPYSVSLGALTSKDSVLVLTGIANPRPMLRYLKSYPFRKKIARFPDHHDFSRNDIEKIQKDFDSLKGQHRIILTTEKDAVRLASNPYFPQELKPYTFYIPVSVRLMEGIDGYNYDFLSSFRDSIGFGVSDSYDNPM